ncbi:MAG: ATP phosphoribosyltransferase [Dehalococcoidales bacterium]|nr:ATP phosphoribosyltransferase [Dehalococcoidales bacterium]
MKLALPKGRLLRKTAAILQRAGWGLDEYTSNMGFYRPQSQKFSDVLIRVFHEKDIPVQIAMGNYDLGICCLDWIEELLAKYPSSDIIKVQDLQYGVGALYVAAATVPEDLRQNGTPVRIASEYSNLAEAYALRKRMSRFSIFPVWGAAEAYPPENADMVLIPARTGAALADCGMVPVSRMLDFSAFLIANKRSWETKELDKLVTSICDTLSETDKKLIAGEERGMPAPARLVKTPAGTVRLALPDGHQQKPTVDLLNRAGIGIDDYPSETGNRRPKIDIDGVTVKVIRPQDMPLQVANGNFDLAVTGRDWLTEHLSQFPSSPVRELLDLKSSKVRIVAVVHQELQVDDTEDLRRLIAGRDEPFRVASEYVNIADKYARDNHLGHYSVIPTWGATEAFLPDDADMLIENTETGRTLARHNLKIIDTLFESTGCLIGNADSASAAKKKRIEAVVARLRKAVGDK